jgi:Ulp1 family protease
MTRLYHQHILDPAKMYTFDFVDPTVVSYFLHQLSPNDSDDKDEFQLLGRKWIDASQERTCHFIFVPINSNFSKSSHEAFTTGHGLHWSLLLVMIHKGILEFYHFDSSYSFNMEAAQIVASRMKFILSLVMIHLMNTKDDEILDKEIRITECKCTQQCNGYDCGIHTLINVEAIMEGLKTFRWMTSAEEDLLNHEHVLYSQLQRHLEDRIQATSMIENKADLSITTESMRHRILQDILTIATK